ncbi:MAG TPA: DUF2252 family protein [Bryobacteraceae bacterium]|nr:DUF2252 family protein [Bryobacteraceae bacterium]
MPKQPLPDIRVSTKRYEDWLGSQIRLIRKDILRKHAEMSVAPFPFMRATYYRWAEVWPRVCGAAASAPETLSVGDLHAENFGTWRDAEGRLIWGVNDFDEASWLPYTNDLIRLASSVLLAIDAEHIGLNRKDACAVLLAGYRKSLEAGGRPFALAEHHVALREMARSRIKDAAVFWEKLSSLESVKDKVPGSARKAIIRMLPDPKMKHRLVHRAAGLGSLGRQRFAGIGVWCGGMIAREAKELALSACVWAGPQRRSGRILYQQILRRAVRCPDPFVRLRESWIVRRLAPDCSRIELQALPRQRDEVRLLDAMGWETANIHLGTAKPRDILQDLNNRPSNWLNSAAAAMADVVHADWSRWRKG